MGIAVNKPLVRTIMPLGPGRRLFMPEVKDELYDNNQRKWLLDVSRRGQMRVLPLREGVNLTTYPAVMLSKHHGSMLGMWEYAHLTGITRKKALLVHIDCHHDLMSGDYVTRPGTPGEAIARYAAQAGFIIPAMMMGLVSEYYWVLPLSVNRGNLSGFMEKYSLTADHQFPDQIKLAKANHKQFKQFCSAAAVNGRGERIFSSNLEPDEYEYSQFGKIIPTHMTFLEGLPDMRREKRDIILDIDLDWVGLRADCPCQFRAGIELLIQTIKDRGIYPKLVNIVLSPDYSHPSIISPRNLPDIFKALFE